MRLTRLVLEDFGPYQHTDLDFGAVRDVVIMGANGHGKTMLLDGFTWTLVDRHRYGTRQDHLVRDGAGIARVRVEFTAGGRQIAVVREKPLNKTGTLSLYVDGAEHKSHTQDETFERIRRLIGLSWEGLAAGPLMVQKDQYPGNLVSLATAGPAARADLLIEVADLGFYDAAYNESVDRGKAIAGKREALTQQRDRLIAAVERRAEVEQAVATARAAREAAEAKVVAQRQTVVEAEKVVARHEAAREQRDAVHGRVTAAAEAIQAHDQNLTTLQRGLTAAQERVAMKFTEADELPALVGDDEVAALQAQIAEAAEAESAVREAERILTASGTAIERIEHWKDRVSQAPCGGKGKYATCPFLMRPEDFDQLDTYREQQTTATATAAEQKPTAEKSRELVESLQSLMDRRTDAVRARGAVETARAAHEAAHAAAQERIVALEAQVNEATAAKERDQGVLERALAEKHALDEKLAGLTAAEQALDDAKIALAAAERAYAATEAPVTEAEADLLSIRRAEAERTEVVAAVEAADSEYDTMRGLAKGFHRTGIPTLIMEDGVIPAIEQHANELLTRLPDAMRIRLVTQTERKTGKIADTLDIIVESKGHERPYEGLSIGQRFRIDLACRVAQGHALRHRSGRSIDMIWLDEPVANADTVSAMAAAEALAGLSDQFGLVVVVSHHEAFSEFFSNRLDVVQDAAGIATATIR